MRYFKKLVALPIVILPGRGRVYDTDLLVGDEYAQYVPLYLYETDERGWPLSANLSPPPPAPVEAHTVPHAPAHTHVSSPVRPPPPPELAKAWEERHKAIATALKSPAGLNSLEDALAVAQRETVPVTEPEPPKVPQPQIEATMAPTDPPKRKRGRPRKHPLPPPPPPKPEGQS